MTDQENIVFSALSRGRLIFPHLQEMRKLKKLSLAGLTDDENFRLRNLEAAHTKIKQKDAWFHSQMQAGDHGAAAKTAQAALKDLQDIP